MREMLRNEVEAHPMTHTIPEIAAVLRRLADRIGTPHRYVPDPRDADVRLARAIAGELEANLPCGWICPIDGCDEPSAPGTCYDCGGQMAPLHAFPAPTEEGGDAD